MGATLPVLSRFFVRSFAQFGRRVGDLYATNTLGAVIAVYAIYRYGLTAMGAELVLRVNVEGTRNAVGAGFERLLIDAVMGLGRERRAGPLPPAS